MSDTTSNPGNVERDLDETRSRLGSHLSQLEERLSPGQVIDDLMAYFRGSEGADFGRSLIESMRANPIPATLTGIGLAWLMASNTRAETDKNPSSRVRVYPSHHYGRDDHGATITRLREAEQRVTRNPGETDDAYSGRLDEARGQAVGLARHAQETADGFGSRVRDAVEATQRALTDSAQNVRDQVSGAVGAAGSVAGSVGSATRDRLQDAAQYASGALSHGGQSSGQALSVLTESPVLLGALGLAAGALLGALIPQSEQEEAALGGVAGQARRVVSNLASEGMERGQRVAQTVMEKAQDSAREHGLSTDTSVGEVVNSALQGDLTENAKGVAQELLHTGKEAIRSEVSQADKNEQRSSRPSSRSAAS